LQEDQYLGILQNLEDLDIDMEEEEFMDLVLLLFIQQQWKLLMNLLP
jgi:hypothetical protein